MHETADYMHYTATYLKSGGLSRTLRKAAACFRINLFLC